MVSNECYKNACKEKDLVYRMTETDSVQVGLELSAFTSVSPPFYFKSDFHYKTREKTANMGSPVASHPLIRSTILILEPYVLLDTCLVEGSSCTATCSGVSSRAGALA